MSAWPGVEVRAVALADGVQGPAVLRCRGIRRTHPVRWHLVQAAATPACNLSPLCGCQPVGCDSFPPSPVPSLARRSLVAGRWRPALRFGTAQRVRSGARGAERRRGAPPSSSSAFRLCFEATAWTPEYDEVGGICDSKGGRSVERAGILEESVRAFSTEDPRCVLLPAPLFKTLLLVFVRSVDPPVGRSYGRLARKVLWAGARWCGAAADRTCCVFDKMPWQSVLLDGHGLLQVYGWNDHPWEELDLFMLICWHDWNVAPTLTFLQKYGLTASPFSVSHDTLPTTMLLYLEIGDILFYLQRLVRKHLVMSSFRDWNSYFTFLQETYDASGIPAPFPSRIFKLLSNVAVLIPIESLPILKKRQSYFV